MIASSILSPPTRTERAKTIPPSDSTATSVVPPPISTTIEAVGSVTGKPAPMPAAIASSIRKTLRAPALGGIADGAPLDRGRAGRYADDDLRIEQAASPMHLPNKMLDHLLCGLEIRNDPVP